MAGINMASDKPELEAAETEYDRVLRELQSLDAESIPEADILLLQSGS